MCCTTWRPCVESELGTSCVLTHVAVTWYQVAHLPAPQCHGMHRLRARLAQPGVTTALRQRSSPHNQRVSAGPATPGAEWPFCHWLLAVLCQSCHRLASCLQPLQLDPHAKCRGAPDTRRCPSNPLPSPCTHAPKDLQNGRRVRLPDKQLVQASDGYRGVSL